MKTLIAVLSLLATATTVHAETTEGLELNGASRVTLDAPTVWEPLRHDGRGMRNTGIALTIAGAALTGTFAYLVATTPPSAFGLPSTERFYWEVGIGTAGLSALGSGVALWIIGSHRMAVAPFVAPRPGGAMAGITITRF
ncbi:MAG TPA: hypothetical protein VKN99_02645 [Polyangia bacterium]|nr:hypothetical protein [Polyangia bacterium]